MPVPRNMSPWQLGSAAVVLVGLVASVVVAMNGYVRSDASPKPSLCAREKRAKERVFGGRPPEPPLLPARSRTRSAAYRLARTCARPHKR